MSVADTSLQAYKQLIEANGISPSRKAMVQVLEEMDCPLTRWEISKYTEMWGGKYYPINSVTPRINELIEMGIVMEDGTTKKCSVTGNTAKVVKLVK